MQTGQPNIKKTSFLLQKTFLLLLIVGALSWGWKEWEGAQEDRHKKDQKTLVQVSQAHQQDVPVYLEALGSVTPDKSVLIKTQVSGVLTKIHFEDGQMVKTGDLLADIDPRTYEAQLAQYQGQLAKDQALLNNAVLDLNRDVSLKPKGFVSKQALDTQEGLVRQYEGAVKTDQALIDAAQVNLSYCRILAPMDGRMGLRLVDEGNVVQPSDTQGLVILNTIHPMNVFFSVPEDHVSLILNQLKKGEKPVVEAYDRAQGIKLTSGLLETMDNEIDATTGTIKLKGVFENQDEVLFPNQFVNIRLKVRTLPNATLVPTAALQDGVKGSFVFTTDLQTQKVHIKNVTRGPAWGEDTVITDGLVPGEFVVTEGTDKLKEGDIVTLAHAPAKEAPQGHAKP